MLNWNKSIYSQDTEILPISKTKIDCLNDSDELIVNRTMENKPGISSLWPLLGL